jgi:hypothetical protein
MDGEAARINRRIKATKLRTSGPLLHGYKTMTITTILLKVAGKKKGKVVPMLN